MLETFFLFSMTVLSNESKKFCMKADC